MSSPAGSASATQSIFSTGYQANLSLIGGLCGTGDIILIDSDSRAPASATRRLRPRRRSSASGTTRRGACAGGSSGSPRRDATGSSSSRGCIRFAATWHRCARSSPCAARTEIPPRGRSAFARGTYGWTAVGCAEDEGILDEVDFVVGTFSKSLAGVCVSNHPELRALHFLARAYVFTASGSPSNVASVSAAVEVVRAHPELRDQLWSNVRRLRQGLRELGYAIGETA